MSKPIPVHVEGLARLCFLPNGRFTGRIAGNDDSQFSVVGGADYCLQAHEDPHDHKCCYDDSCKFRDLTVFDYDGYGKSTLVPKVLQSGGEKCTLASPNVKFLTEELITGDKADDYIDKFLQPELKDKGCYVCVGQMKISFPEPLEGDGLHTTEEQAKSQ